MLVDGIDCSIGPMLLQRESISLLSTVENPSAPFQIKNKCTNSTRIRRILIVIGRAGVIWEENEPIIVWASATIAISKEATKSRGNQRCISKVTLKASLE